MSRAEMKRPRGRARCASGRHGWTDGGLWVALPKLACSAILVGLAMISGGCNAPGKPGPLPAESLRPEQVLDFKTLYSLNCAACHGADGRNGAAISLANPVYLETASVKTIEAITAHGVPNSLMPAFARSSGGMLTDQQVMILAQGMVNQWGNPSAHASDPAIDSAGPRPPAYAASTKGDANAGGQAFNAFCARCHVEGNESNGVGPSRPAPGSLLDPAYLALITDQGLRSLIIAGQPEQGMPDWRHDLTGPGASVPTDQNVTDIVAWLASHRTQAPGQPYNKPQ